MKLWSRTSALPSSFRGFLSVFVPINNRLKSFRTCSDLGDQKRGDGNRSLVPLAQKRFTQRGGLQIGRRNGGSGGAEKASHHRSNERQVLLFEKQKGVRSSIKRVGDLRCISILSPTIVFFMNELIARTSLIINWLWLDRYTIGGTAAAQIACKSSLSCMIISPNAPKSRDENA